LRHATTCAGLIGLAVGHGSDKKDKKKLSSDVRVKKALDYLSKPIGSPLRTDGKGNTMANVRGKYFGADAVGDTYFLWSVERVAVIYNLAKIGGKDWYSWARVSSSPSRKATGAGRNTTPAFRTPASPCCSSNGPTSPRT
jgi:hypothetical protein